MDIFVYHNNNNSQPVLLPGIKIWAVSMDESYQKNYSKVAKLTYPEPSNLLRTLTEAQNDTQGYWFEELNNALLFGTEPGYRPTKPWDVFVVDGIGYVIKEERFAELDFFSPQEDETVKSAPFLNAFFEKQQLSAFTSEIFVDMEVGGAVCEFQTFSDMKNYFCGSSPADVIDEVLNEDLITEKEADAIKEDIDVFSDFLSILSLDEISMIAKGVDAGGIDSCAQLNKKDEDALDKKSLTELLYLKQLVSEAIGRKLDPCNLGSDLFKKEGEMEVDVSSSAPSL